jgi:iron complex outermembrane receptor protein
VTLNGALFYYNYYNDQVPLTVQNAQSLLVPVLFNLPLVHDYGFEFEGVWRPIDPLVLSLQYSYLNARIANAGGCIEDTVDPLALQRGANLAGCANVAGSTAIVQNVTGQTLPESPPNKVSFNALYTVQFDPGKLVLSGSVIWKDVTYASIFNRPAYEQPAYTQVNLRATYSSADGRYTVIGFINNLFDSQGFDAAVPALLAGPTQTGAATEDIINGYSLTAPRTFGLQVQYRFK